MNRNRHPGIRGAVVDRSSYSSCLSSQRHCLRMRSSPKGTFLNSGVSQSSGSAQPNDVIASIVERRLSTERTRIDARYQSCEIFPSRLRLRRPPSRRSAVYAVVSVTAASNASKAFARVRSFLTLAWSCRPVQRSNSSRAFTVTLIVSLTQDA